MERIDLKKLIAEAREIAEALDEFADKLEKIEKGVEKSMSFTADITPDGKDYDDFVIARHMHEKYKYSNNGFPHFMEELTEDDLEESEV